MESSSLKPLSAEEINNLSSEELNNLIVRIIRSMNPEQLAKAAEMVYTMVEGEQKTRF